MKIDTSDLLIESRLVFTNMLSMSALAILHGYNCRSELYDEMFVSA
jgi:hypothetical protein